VPENVLPQSELNNGSAGNGDSCRVAESNEKKDSVIVNGVTFNVSGAQIREGAVPIDEAQLQNRVVIKVSGRLNSDGLTGTAEKVKSLIEIMGTITVKDADSITVLVQQIFVDSRTAFDNGLNIQAIAEGQKVGVRRI
jgi:hypothetical protein